MELIKLSNTPSKKVESYKEIEAIIPEFTAFIDEYNGKFKGTYSEGYAFSHCQVEAENPLQLIVIAKDWTVDGAPANMPKDQLFKHRIVVNPRIVEVPSHTFKEVERVNPLTNRKEMSKAKFPNAVRLKEGCMSFPHKTAKNVDRFFEVTVEYRVPQKFLGLFWRLKKVRERVTGLKAHIFQHECDHMQGKNIYYGDRVR